MRITGDHKEIAAVFENVVLASPGIERLTKNFGNIILTILTEIRKHVLSKLAAYIYTHPFDIISYFGNQFLMMCCTLFFCNICSQCSSWGLFSGKKQCRIEWGPLHVDWNQIKSTVDHQSPSSGTTPGCF